MAEEKNAYNELKSIIDKFSALFSEGISIKTILTFISQLIMEVEKIVDAPESGKTKHGLVKHVLIDFNEKFGIIKYLIKLIPYSSIPFLSLLYGKIVWFVIDELIIPAIVIFANMTIWK